MREPRPLQSIGVFAARAAAGGSVVIVNALLARTLSLEHFGLFVLLSAITTFLATIGQLGLNYSVVRLLARDLASSMAQRTRADLKIVLLLLCGGLLGSSLFFLSFGNKVLQITFQVALQEREQFLVIGWIVGLGFQSIIAEAFRGYGRLLEATLFGGTFTALSTLAVVSASWLLHDTLPVPAVLMLVTAPLFANNILSGLLLYRVVPRSSHRPRTMPGEYMEVLRSSLPVMFSSAGMVLVFQADIWAISAFQSEDQVGIYGASARLAGVLLLIIAIPHATHAALIAHRYATGDLGGLEAAIRRAATYTFAASLLPASLMLMFPSEVLATVYGTAYRDGAPVLRLITAGFLVNAFTGLRGLTLIMCGQAALHTKITLVTGLINVVACVSAARLGGIALVAFAASSAMILQCIVESLFVYRTVGISTYSSIDELFIRRRTS